jgi:hypothetical protein
MSLLVALRTASLKDCTGNCTTAGVGRDVGEADVLAALGASEVGADRGSMLHALSQTMSADPAIR